MSRSRPARGTWHTAGRLLALGLNHPWAFSLNILGLLFLGVMSMVFVILTRSILEVFGPVISDTTILWSAEQTADGIARLRSHGVLFCALALPVGILAGGAWYVSQWLANRTMMDLRARFLDRFLRLHLGFHSQISKGDLIARMSADVEITLHLVLQLYGKVIQRPLEIVFTVIGCFVVEWRLATILFFGLIPVIFLLERVFRRTRKRAQRARTTLAHTLSTFEQAVSGIRVIKSLGTQNVEVERFDRVNRALMQAEMRTARTRANADVITYMVAFLVPGLAMFAGVWLIDTGSLSGATMGAFLMALGRITTMFRTTQRLWGEVVREVPAADRIFEILEQESAIVDRPDAAPCPEPRVAIRLEHVHFSYAADAEEVLSACSFEIPVGRTVALVGESGVGKSTVLDLIPRFYDVTGGRITFDGADIRDYQHEGLVSHFAIVEQESFLFNDTIYNNIAYGRAGASRAEIELAARRAHLHEAILALEGGAGYETVVGDRGDRLSGGQRQRVAIARALLRDAPILILDEPTSALDADSEAHVQAALEELMQGRTSIIVAHRLATVQHADIIYVLGSGTGRVVESGTHAELLAQGGEYARLVELQQLRV